MDHEEHFIGVVQLIKASLEFRGSLGGYSFTARPGMEYELQFVAGITRHVEYLYHAADKLMNDDLEHATPPIVRLMLENAVTAALVARDPQSWQAVLVKTRQSEKSYWDTMQRLDIQPTDDADRLFAQLPEDEGNGYREFRTMTGRFKDFPQDGDALLASWQRLSQMSHGNYLSAALFLGPSAGPGGIPSVRVNPQWEQDRLFIYGTCLDSVLICLEALNASLDGEPLTEWVQELVQRHIDLIEASPEFFGEAGSVHQLTPRPRAARPKRSPANSRERSGLVTHDCLH
jgi:hypothetical protein